MTFQADFFMGPDTQQNSEPRTRLARYLSRHFPTADGYPAKRLSKAIGCTVKTAENYLAGHWPSSKNWQRIAILFGSDVLDAAFGPDIEGTVDRLRQEEIRLEKALLETRARRLSVEGADTRAEERLAAVQERSVVELDPKARSKGARR